MTDINAKKSFQFLEKTFYSEVLGAGLEPARGCPHRILSPVRLPIPPSEHFKVLPSSFPNSKLTLF